MTDQTVYRSDYQPYDFHLEEIKLVFEIHEGTTTVQADLYVKASGSNRELQLDGEDVELETIAIDGRTLSSNEYRVDDESLTIFNLPPSCVVSVRTRICPEENTVLEGLYKSGSMYCTQCEAEGFRRITYYPDRPDVLTRFTTTITADAEAYPTLLSNGNLIGDETKGRRRSVTWQDPFLKPSYLFALVAGDLAVMTDSFETMSGRIVDLRIYSEPHNIDQCSYAMDALKRAMCWDEEVFGREYDLDVFMIVAVEDFNMGAMENKGLNIFNTSCVLASRDTATDAGHQRVEAVVAHEYFHNWSGNRVTCRDWFQLSLKEGFTVFRDAEFSSDMNSRTVKRIEDVEFLRNVQFPEDAGPLAHPIRPNEYEQISNFYTTTVYEKGAEVVRMLQTILGADLFRDGTDLYFSRHDGSAVTTEDFVLAMEEVAEVDLTQFRRWYSQSGTPTLSVTETRGTGWLQLQILQECPATPGQNEKRPFHIPVAIGLSGDNGVDHLGVLSGNKIALVTEARVDNPNADGTLVVHVVERETTLRFDNVPENTSVSFLRGFSAPVKVDYRRPAQELGFLTVNDSDGFARWDSAQSLLVSSMRGESTDANILEMYERLLSVVKSARDDGEMKALIVAMLKLPREQYLLDLEPGSDIMNWFDVRERMADTLSVAFREEWLALFEMNSTAKSYEPDGKSIARRQLRNFALSCYARTAPDAADIVCAELDSADNLTDRASAFALLLNLKSADYSSKQTAIEAFFERWHDKALVVDFWFSAQASCVLPGTLERVEELESHRAFDIKNPNKIRALFGAFAGNVPNFHQISGLGYTFLAERVARLDKTNPSIAARLTAPLTRWQRFDVVRQRRMRTTLKGLGDRDLSKDLNEVVSKSLVSHLANQTL